MVILISQTEAAACTLRDRYQVATKGYALALNQSISPSLLLSEFLRYLRYTVQRSSEQYTENHLFFPSAGVTPRIRRNEGEEMSALVGSVSSLLGTSLCSSILSCEVSSLRPQSAQRSPLVVCQAKSNRLPEDEPTDTSRRSVLLVGASVAAAAAALLNQPDAQAKRKPPPPPEKKEEDDLRNLSALDAKKLANARRKEAMRAMLESAKEKSKNVQEPARPPTSMSIGATS